MTQEAGVPAGFWAKVEQVAKKVVNDYVRAGLLNSASISSGGLTIKNGGALTLMNNLGTGEQFYIGPVIPSMPDGTGQPGVILRREDGSLALALYDPDPSGTFQQFLALYDRSDNIIVSDDTDSGQGLARPYVPGVFYRERYADWVTTMSTTFETLFTAVVYKQHPQLWVQVWASNDTSGATGELRILVNGVQWQTTASTGFTVATASFGPAPVDGAHMASLKIEVQARVATGTGGVRVEPRAAHGMQS